MLLPIFKPACFDWRTLAIESSEFQANLVIDSFVFNLNWAYWRMMILVDLLKFEYSSFQEFWLTSDWTSWCPFSLNPHMIGFVEISVEFFFSRPTHIVYMEYRNLARKIFVWSKNVQIRVCSLPAQKRMKWLKMTPSLGNQVCTYINSFLII